MFEEPSLCSFGCYLGLCQHPEAQREGDWSRSKNPRSLETWRWPPDGVTGQKPFSQLSSCDGEPVIVASFIPWEPGELGLKWKVPN